MSKLPSKHINKSPTGGRGSDIYSTFFLTRIVGLFLREVWPYFRTFYSTFFDEDYWSIFEGSLAIFFGRLFYVFFTRIVGIFLTEVWPYFRTLTPRFLTRIVGLVSDICARVLDGNSDVFREQICSSFHVFVWMYECLHVYAYVPERERETGQRPLFEIF